MKLEAGKKYRHTPFEHEVLCLFADDKSAFVEYTKVQKGATIKKGDRIIMSSVNYFIYQEIREPLVIYAGTLQGDIDVFFADTEQDYVVSQMQLHYRDRQDVSIRKFIEVIE